MKRSNNNFTTGQVAEFCDVSQRTVINWIERGELSAHKLPGRGDRRISRPELEAFFTRNNLPLPEGLHAPGRSILVVDDDAEMSASLARLFKSEGFEVSVASDGFAAGLMLAQLRPALMTLDLHLPGLNGWQVLERLQTQPIEGLKILVVSAADAQELARATELGAHGVVSKPFDNEQLLKQVSGYLG